MLYKLQSCNTKATKKDATLLQIKKDLFDFSNATLIRGQLKRPETLIKEFNDIRNFLAANATGITRDTAIIAEMVKILFCKAYEEITKKDTEVLDFQIFREETEFSVKKRIEGLFKIVKDSKPEIFDINDQITLDARSIVYIVNRLQNYSITKANRDSMGEAFETLIGTTLRGNEGQFFTPRNLIKLMIRMVNPKPNESLIDPACGSGGFLVIALDHMLKHKGKIGVDMSGQECEVCKNILGIDKDSFLANLARVYFALLSGNGAQVFCENSLAPPDSWSPNTQSRISLGSFDVVVTNPPFGSKIPVSGEKLLSQYELGYIWKNGKEKNFPTNKLKNAEAPQILFIERCLDLLKDGGRMAIVLPEGILGNVGTSYVRSFIRKEAEVIAIIDCPLETFLPSTPTKVCILILQKNSNPQQRPVFMAIAEKCGHDRRGVPIFRPDKTIDDDFPLIADAFESFRRKNNVLF